jgi:hypothetical protein
MKPFRLFKALTLEMLALLLGTLISELMTSPTEGHRIDFTKLPAAAKAISTERPGVPISPDQWKRLDAVMARHGGWPSGGELILASMRASWYLFLLLPSAGIAVILTKWRAVTLWEVAGVCLPSLLALLFAFSTVASMLRA